MGLKERVKKSKHCRHIDIIHDAMSSDIGFPGFGIMSHCTSAFMERM